MYLRVLAGGGRARTCGRGREDDEVDIAAAWDGAAGAMWAGRDGGRCASFSCGCLDSIVYGNSTEVSRPIAGGSAQFHPSGLTLSGKWDSRCSGQCQPCIWESTTLLGGGYRGTGDGSWGFPCGRGPSFSGTNHHHWPRIYRSASPEGADDKGPTRAGGMAKSQTPETPTLTRAMRHIKWPTSH